MYRIEQDFSLKELNGFKLNVKAKYFVSIKDEKDLEELMGTEIYRNEKKFILGGGYNTLFESDFDGLIISVDIEGISKTEEGEEVILEAGAGVSWPELVDFSVKQKLTGVENMADIPGEVGAAPIGNIAAYGQSQSDTFVSLNAYEIATGKKVTLSKQDCEFVYRNSKFKKDWKIKYIITKVRYTLKKVTDYHAETNYWSRYESLDSVLKQFATPPYSLEDVWQAVKEIRALKLPDYRTIPSLGSVFMNPIITGKQLREIRKTFPGMQYYPVEGMKYTDLYNVTDEELVKIPAGWIFEEIGFKGKRIGKVGTYKEHALIMTTDEGATSEETYEFLMLMKREFEKATGLRIEPEVVIV